MKSLIAIASLLVAFSANAGEYTTFESVLFQTASTWVPGNKVCRDGNFLKHTQKEYVAVETNCSGGEAGNHCDIVYKKLLQPVVGVTQRCVKSTGGDNDNCKVYASVPFDQSTVKVKKSNSDGRGERVVGTYTIPACK